MQANLSFPKSSELQSDTEDEIPASILLSSEFRAIAGDLIAQVSAKFGFKKHLDRVME